MHIVSAPRTGSEIDRAISTPARNSYWSTLSRSLQEEVMRVPVILLVPAHQHLRDAATEATKNMAAGVDPGKVPTYPGVEIDASFAPVPLGSAQPEFVTMAETSPSESKFFAIRGHVTTREGEPPPPRAGDAIVFSDPQIREFLTCGGTPPVGNASTVANLLKVGQLGMKQLSGTGVAVAVVDTGINLGHLNTKLGHAPHFDASASWSPPATPPPVPGGWPVNHGTMCAYDVLIAAPEATLVDFPVLSASFPGGGSIMSGTLSAALAAYGFMLQSWASGPLHRYKALVASNSWGIFHPSWDFPAGHPGRYCDNPGHPFNVQIGVAVRSGIDVIFAAGNCGAPCADGRCQGRTTGAIMGASAMRDVLTIAGCDTHDARVGYSSQGPSIPGMFNEKPDITAYTHFLGSEAFGAGTPDTGTSAACPVTSGCVAALRTSPKIPPLTAMPPAKLFDVLRATARQQSGAPHTWNGDYGFGIVDPLAAAASMGL
jgi:subtilisin family serine protease